jgi:hypothetical protein
VADLGAFDMRSSSGRGGFRAGIGVSRSAFPELWRAEGRREYGAAAEVHAPASVKERQQRARLKEYKRLKEELLGGASGRAETIPAATDEGENR